MSDIVITWPKDRPLESYLNECYKALASHQSINFHVHALPTNCDPGDKCYIVHTGFVRCYHVITGLGYRAEKHVMDPVTKEYWPQGNYIIRDPEPHMLSGLPRPMAGFQGWRYYA